MRVCEQCGKLIVTRKSEFGKDEKYYDLDGKEHPHRQKLKGVRGSWVERAVGTVYKERNK